MVSINQQIVADDSTHSVDSVKILKVLYLLADKFVDDAGRIVNNDIIPGTGGAYVCRLTSLGGSASITSGGTFSGQPVSAERGATSSSTVMSTVNLPYEGNVNQDIDASYLQLTLLGQDQA